LLPETSTIRDGNYGGILILFNEEGDEVIILSSLNRFMVQNMRHLPNEDPSKDRSHPGVLSFGLMGSIETIPAGGLDLETIIVYGNSFEDAFERFVIQKEVILPSLH